ncbi:MAG: LysM peptidoglycan-binding domain-containing protein [Anaerolineae bacterium]|jgi:LysM repeat protein|nr:LysM peptidoglycan-binding domain-containing protein [Anaerolineae bacterium]
MKIKSRATKVILTAMVLFSMMLLSACELSKATPPPQPTLAIPINTVVVEDEAEEEISIDDSIEIIETPIPEEEEEEDVAKEVEATEAPTEEPQPTATTVEVPEIVRPESYTLMKDEFPYCIARRFDVNIADLMALNGLSGGQSYYEGMVLKIPTSGNWDEASHGNRSLRAHPVVYTVQSGESIYNIACKFGDVSPEQIAAKNGIEKPYSLSPGMELQIP